MKRDLREISVRVTPEGIVYEGLEEFMDEEDYDWETMNQTLESLADKDYLMRRGHTRVLLCPKCSSPHVYSKYACTKCNSMDISHIKLIEHVFCGYTGVWDKFVKKARLVCPNCDTDMGSIYSRPPGDGSQIDYRVIGTTYECEKCGNRFDRPTILHECQECGSTFDFKKSRYEKIFNYWIPDDVVRKLRVIEEISVLVIEDDPDDAKIIEMNLVESKSKFKVQIADTGENGLDNVKKNIFDVILLDYNLPDMNGVDVLREIKGLKVDTPVIVLTGADDREIAVSLMKMGASDYLVKSVELYQELPSIIGQIVGRKK